MQILTPKPKAHLFVCINDKPGDCCGKKIDLETFRSLKGWLVEEGLASTIYCTKVGCLGFCNPEGGVVAVYPEGKFISGIQGLEDLKIIVREAI
jgi:(2Fe-2S) ferredoxin